MCLRGSGEVVVKEVSSREEQGQAEALNFPALLNDAQVVS